MINFQRGDPYHSHNHAQFHNNNNNNQVPPSRELSPLNCSEITCLGGRQSSASDDRVSSSSPGGYENCGSQISGFIVDKGSVELKCAPVSNGSQKSKLSLEETQHFLDNDASSYYVSKKLSNGINGSYSTVSTREKSRAFIASCDKTKSFDHVTLSSADEYFLTLDRNNRFINLSPSNNSNPLGRAGAPLLVNKCRIVWFVCLCSVILLTFCLTLVLFNFTDLVTSCHSKFFCLSGQSSPNTSSQQGPPLDNTLANDTTDAWNRARLPTDVAPLHYHLMLNVDDKRGMFYGNVSIKFTAKRFTHFLILHAAKQLTLRSKPSWITASDERTIPVNAISRVAGQKSEEYLVLLFGNDLTLNEVYRVDLEFESYLNTRAKHGLYISYAEDNTGEKFPVILWNSFPSFARHVFPCFDEPGFRASFRLDLVADRRFEAVSNMPENQSRVLDESRDGKKLWWFKVLPPCATYLYSLALLPPFTTKKFVLQELSPTLQVIVLNEYRAWEDASRIVPSFPRHQGNNNIVINNNNNNNNDNNREDVGSIGWDALLSEEANVILDFSSSAVSFMVQNSLLQVPSSAVTPPKLDIIYSSCAPEFGIVSNGLVVLPQNTKYLAFLVSKATISQLINNLFSVNWWDDFWVLEGFSSFLALKSLQGRFSSSTAQNQLFSVDDPAMLHNQRGEVAEMVQSSIETGIDLTLSVLNEGLQQGATKKTPDFKSHVVYRVLNPTHQLARSVKASTVFLGIDFIHSWLLVNILKDISSKSSSGAYPSTVNVKNFLMDIQLNLRESRGFDMHAYLFSWTYTPAFPVVKLSYEESRNALLAIQQPITRQHLSANKSNRIPMTNDYSWSFRVGLDFGTSQMSEYWLDQVWKELQLSETIVDFVLAIMCGSADSSETHSSLAENAQFRAHNVGWYLPLYDSQLLRKLKFQLSTKFNYIPEFERFALIRGYFTLTKLNVSPASTILDLIQYSKNETSSQLKTVLHEITQFFMHRFEMRYPYFLKKYFGDIWSSIYELECASSNMETNYESCSKVTVENACYFGNEKCLAQSSVLLDTINQQFKYIPSHVAFERWLTDYVRDRSNQLVSAAAFADPLRWTELFQVCQSLRSSFATRNARTLILTGLARNTLSLSSLLWSIEASQYTSEELAVVLSECVQYSDGWMVLSHYLTQSNGAKINPLIYRVASEQNNDRFCSRFLARYSRFITQKSDLVDFQRIVRLFIVNGCSCCLKQEFSLPVLVNQIQSQIEWYDTNDNSTNSFFNQFYFV